MSSDVSFIYQLCLRHLIGHFYIVGKQRFWDIIVTERRPKWDLLGFVPWRHSYILLDTFIHSFIYFYYFSETIFRLSSFLFLSPFWTLLEILSFYQCFWFVPLATCHVMRVSEKFGDYHFFYVYAVCSPCNCYLQFWYIFALLEHHPLMPQWSGCLTSLRFRPVSRLTFEIFVLLMSVFVLTAC